MHEEQILRWQPFFITVATLAGTLVGLLFISLSINRDKITAHANLLRLARRSFSDFLHVVLISLFFLIPVQGNHALGIELLVIGLSRIRLMFRQMKSPKGETGGWKWLSEFLLPVLSTLGFLTAGLEIYLGGESAVYAIYYGVVPVIAILLTTACSNAWRLLMEEK